MTAAMPPSPAHWPGNSPHPVIELDRSGVVLHANAAARALAGDDELQRLLPDDIGQRVAQCLDSGADDAGIERTVRARTIVWTLRPLESGASVGAFGVDVTDWKDAASALRRKDDLLRGVAEAARAIVSAPGGDVPLERVVERLGRATGVNRAYVFRNSLSPDGVLLASQVAEWTQAHVEPQIDNPDLQDVPYLDAGMGRWAQELANGNTVAGTIDEFPPEEQDILRPQGIRTLVVTPIIVDGGAWGFIGFDDCEVMRRWSPAELDILRAAADTVASALQRENTLAALEDSREQLRHAQRMEAVGRLAGGIAHDFNNILSGILGYAEILLEELRPAHFAREGLEEIRRSSLRAAALTKQLLAFSRKQPVQFTAVDLADLVGGLQGLIERLIGSNVSVDVGVEPGTPAVRADAGQLEQIVLNLVVNARDAMPDGGRIRLRAGRAALVPEDLRDRGLDAGREYVLLSVEDSGCGMSAETGAKAFEPFFTTKDTGTGMGLSIIYGIAKQSEGSAWIRSAPGAGTCVTVALPAADADARAEPAARELQDLRGDACVLLVEDTAAVRVLMSQILGNAGYQVLEAGSAAAAIDILHSRADQIDLMIADIGLPDRSGGELADEACALLPQLPVLFISGYPGDRTAARSPSDFPAEFLAKPFTKDQLLQQVRRSLGATSIAAPS